MTAHPLHGRRIVLGVSGSIACYKAADLASKLTQAGAEMDVVLTRAAAEFVTPLTFQSVTGRRAYTDDDLWGHEAHVLHIGLAHGADLLLIAPATAHTLAKLAYGLAEDLLSVTALAAVCPLVIAPAMDAGMFSHPATQENVRILRAARRSDDRPGGGPSGFRAGGEGAHERTRGDSWSGALFAVAARAAGRVATWWSARAARASRWTRCASSATAPPASRAMRWRRPRSTPGPR